MRKTRQKTHRPLQRYVKTPYPLFLIICLKPPFPSRLTLKRKEASNDEELLEVFRKLLINILLLNAIQQFSRYDKFLEKLYSLHQQEEG